MILFEAVPDDELPKQPLTTEVDSGIDWTTLVVS